jgi:hypothetical protein
MLADYVCIMNKNHKSSFGDPVTPVPECCGKPMQMEQAAAPEPRTLTSGAPALAQAKRKATYR